MTRRFVIEQLNKLKWNRIPYVGTQLKKRSAPHFFAHAASVKQLISRKNVYDGEWQILIISNLENGLKEAQVTPVSTAEFLQMDFSSSRITAHADGAVFFLETNPATDLRPATIYTRKGLPHRWKRSGDLRSHLNFLAGRLRYSGSHSYRTSGSMQDYTVLEVVYGTDGVSPKSIRRWTVQDFMRASPRFRTWG